MLQGPQFSRARLYFCAKPFYLGKPLQRMNGKSEIRVSHNQHHLNWALSIYLF